MRIGEWFKPKPLQAQSQWEALYNQMNQILSGQMPAYYDTLAKNAQSAMQSSANTLMSKILSNFAVSGLSNTGASNAAMRDLNSMLARNLAQYLGGAQQQIFSQSLGMLPTAIQGGMQSEAFHRQLTAQNLQALMNAIGNIFGGITSVASMLL